MIEPTCKNCDNDCDNYGCNMRACLIHPQARDYLNRGVIAELKQLKRVAIENYNNAGNNAHYISLHKGREGAFDEVIKLLKNGVK